MSNLSVLLRKSLPFLNWPRASAQTIKMDASAGLTGAIIVLPQAIAFASIAGMPPQYGLYAAMLPAIIAALWGSSWHMVTGPTTAISIAVFASVSVLAVPGTERFIGLVLTLTLLVGLIQFIMGVARMGALVNFISHTVVVGFTAGAACLIAASQLGQFLGLDVPRGLHFHEVILYAAEHMSEFHLWVSLVGLSTLLAGLIARKYLRKFPYMIIAMVVGSLLALIFNLVMGDQHTGIRTVGEVHATLPPLSMPDLSFPALRDMLLPAFVVAILGLTEAVAIARSIANLSGQRIHNNQEFIGQGLANMVGSFFSAYTASGSFNRSGLNYTSGAASPLSAIFSAVFLVTISMFAAPLVAYIPVPAIAAILFIVAASLINVHQVAHILLRQPQERIVFLMTFIGTLVDLERGLLLGILTSLFFYLFRTSQPPIEEKTPEKLSAGQTPNSLITATPLTPICPQAALLELRGSIYFGAVGHVRHHLNAVDAVDPRRKWVLLLARRVNFIDFAGAELLGEEAKRRRAMGGGLFIVGAPPQVHQSIEQAEQINEIGLKRILTHKSDAIAALYPQLDSEVCRYCTQRVFLECQQHLPNGAPRPADTPSQAGIST